MKPPAAQKPCELRGVEGLGVQGGELREPGLQLQELLKRAEIESAGGGGRGGRAAALLLRSRGTLLTCKGTERGGERRREPFPPHHRRTFTMGATRLSLLLSTTLGRRKLVIRSACTRRCRKTTIQPSLHSNRLMALRILIELFPGLFCTPLCLRATSQNSNMWIPTSQLGHFTDGIFERLTGP